MPDMDSIPWQTFSVATAGWLLVAGFVTAMWRGMVVPRRSLDDALHDRDEWRAESRIKDQQLAEKDFQLRHLAEVGETQKSVLSSLGQLTKQAQESP
jgi:hypothetical protein